MDGFSRYNQILINLEDQYKKTFTTPSKGYLFLCPVMSFGLKNVGATYQHAMTLTFHDFIHKILEYYVNDVLAKSVTR